MNYVETSRIEKYLYERDLEFFFLLNHEFTLKFSQRYEERAKNIAVLILVRDLNIARSSANMKIWSVLREN